MASTSGTVSTFNFDQRKILEHAFRRAGMAAEMASAENIQIGQDLIYTILGEWVSSGFPLWTRQYNLLGVQVGGTDAVCPAGTSDVLHAYWRILTPYSGVVTISGGAANATLCSQATSPDVVISATNPSVTVGFSAPTEVDTIGVLLGGTSSITTALQVWTSPDGVSYTLAQTLPSATYAPQKWVYFDLNPPVTQTYVQIQYPGGGSWTVNQICFGMANGRDIEMGPLNIDDYWNLPNKFFQSDRPNSAYVDRQISTPVLKIWPTPNVGAFYHGTVAVLTKRYIMDPGQMTNAIEVPQRGLEALIWRLATRLVDELPDPSSNAPANYFGLMAKQQRIQRMEQNAAKAEAIFWNEERVRAPIRVVPSLRPYTR